MKIEIPSYVSFPNGVWVYYVDTFIHGKFGFSSILLSSYERSYLNNGSYNSSIDNIVKKLENSNVNVSILWDTKTDIDY